MQKIAGLLYEKPGRYISLLAVVLVFGGLGAWLLASSRAATPVASLEAENGTVSSAASKVSDTSASGAQAVKFGTPSAGGSCSGAANTPGGVDPWGGCWPGPGNAGIPAGTTLTAGTIDTHADNQTFVNKDFTALGDLTIYGSHLSFTNCKFQSVVFRAGTDITITHSHSSDVAFSNSHTVRFSYNEISEFEDGVDVTSDTAGQPMASDVVFNDNWVHHPTATYPSHSDGSQIRGVIGINYQHNTFDLGVWIDPPVLNGAIYLENANGSNSQVIVNKNYLNGGTYSLQATGASGSITNNVFGPDYHYGYVYSPVDAGVTIWSGNVTNTGQVVNKP